MPSESALFIIRSLERFTGQKLGEAEMIKTEEMVFNFFPAPIFKFVRSLARSEGRVTFYQVYFSVMNGHLRNAGRWPYVRRFEGRIMDVYLKLWEWLPSSFPDTEMDAIRFLADECEEKQISTAFKIATSYHVRSARYMRKIIEGMRRGDNKSPPVAVWEPLCKTKNVTPPDTETWRQRLEKNREKQVARATSRHATSKILGRLREHNSGLDSSTQEPNQNNRRNRTPGSRSC